MDDTELEEAFRAGLQRRADETDTTVDLLRPVSAARRQRRRRLVVTGVAGLAAAALVAAVVVQNVGRSDGPDGPQVVDEGTSEPLPTDWRTEAWHGLQVEVPADWGWGSAPVGEGQDRMVCGGPSDGEPYVGRPVVASDMCMGSSSDVTPTAPYVWLGVDLPPGELDLGGGWRQTTTEMRGTTLTVGWNDERLAQRIIGSAGSIVGCASSLDGPPTVDSMLTEGLRNPSSAQVCAYRRDEGESLYQLVYATVLGAEDATKYHAQVYDGGFESSPDFCDNRLDERVLITITGDDPYGSTDVTQATVVDPTCREVSGSPGMVSPLSDKGMAAWSRNGAAVTLYGLIGPMG